MLRIHERSDGNPFFALELARALGRDVDPLAPLPVPETLEELLRARIAGLPASTHEALALVAALGTASDSMLERAGVAPAALEPAVSAHVIAREDQSLATRIRCCRPSSTGTSATSVARVHARIARLVEDPFLQALHLALSKDTQDAGVAAALDDAGARRGPWRVCRSRPSSPSTPSA